MSFEIALVFLALIFILITLYFDLLGAGFTFLIAVTVLATFGILTPKEMLSGVANEHAAVVILLVLLGSIYEETNILTGFFDKVFRNVKKTRSFLLRIMLIISPLSAFMNNTPLVALMIPYVKDWAKRHRAPITKLLMPLSFAAILGGAATLIGTSTNMIVNGMIADQRLLPKLKPFSIFDFTLIGGTMVVIGILYLYFVGYYLLPGKSLKISNIQKVQHGRQYAVEAQITAKSPFIGKRFSEIREKFNGLTLFQIVRGDNIYTSGIEYIKLKQDDVLMLLGTTEAISDLINQVESIRIPSAGMFMLKDKLDVVEIVVAENSFLVNRTLSDVNFRAMYDATAIAIHRNGEKITGKLSEIKLRPGDAILLLVGEKFWILSQNTRDFFIISKVREIRKLGWFKSVILVGGTVLVILLSALKIVSLFIGVIVLLITLSAVKITNPKKLGDKIDYDLGFLIVMALAFGKAMLKTGAAEMIANFLIDIFEPLGRTGILVGLYIITALLAGFITNKAAVAIVFPIALMSAKDLAINPYATILIMTYAASANFLTPIGYQTNTMVYGAGGYKFRDFIRVGGLLTIIYGTVAVIMIKIFYM